MNYYSLIAILFQFITTVCAAFTVYIAYSGLSSWKRQLVKKEHDEIAKKILINMKCFCKQLFLARNPLMFINPNDADGLKKEYIKRMEPIDEYFIKLQNDIIVAEVVWGDSIENEFVPLFKMRTKLLLAMSDELKPSMRKESNKRENDRFKILNTSLRIDDPNDEFSAEVMKITSKLESIIKSHFIV